jgi:P27 family predicted phage terminase small subunit
MGQRGPKPLPANVHKLHGNPGKRPLNDSGLVEPAIEIPGIPKHLLPEARKFWKRLTPELEQLGLIAKIDQAALSLVCQEWAWLVHHENMLQRAVRIADAKRAEWEVKPENAGVPYTGGDGTVVPTPNGHWAYSHHWVMRNKHALMLDKFLASFGMNPSARGRVTPSSNQLSLPGIAAPKEGFNAL